MITTYASHTILNFLLGRSTTVVPTLWKLDLSTAPLGFNGVGLVRPADTSYAPLTIPNNKSSFSSASNKIVTFIKEFLWPKSTVAWLPITHFTLSDELNNIWFYGSLTNSPLTVPEASCAAIDANVNQFKLDICGGSSNLMSMPTIKANAILNHFLGNSPFLTPPTNWYLGISSTPLNTEGVGMTEPAASEYHRLILPNNKNTFTEAENFSVTLKDTFKFSKAIAPWGIYKYFFISESLTGENVWWSGKLIHERSVEISTTLVASMDGFKWVLGNCT